MQEMLYKWPEKVHTIERTPSMSELNEILLGQEHLKQNDLSFVFKLHGADDSTLFGCCVLVDELVQQPSKLISIMGDGHLFTPPLSRHVLTTRRCYYILSRLLFFELHFGILNSIFTEERLGRLTKSIGELFLTRHLSRMMVLTNNLIKSRYQMQFCLFFVINNTIALILPQVFRILQVKIETLGVVLINQKQKRHLFQVKRIMSTMRFLIGLRTITMDHYKLYASTIVYVSPQEGQQRNFIHFIIYTLWNFVDQMKLFYIWLAHRALAVEEEATALSVWAISCICGSMRLEHVLTIFTGALLEKQIVFVCSNLVILSTSVLSIIPLIRSYRWRRFFVPVLPNDMLDFLHAPMPFVSRTAKVQSKSGNVILVDANKNQVKSSYMPHFPQYKELYAALTPYHA